MDAATEIALRARIAELQAEARRLQAKLPKVVRVFEQVRALLLEGCNTSQDIADELGMTVSCANAHLGDLARRGLARRTGRRVKIDGGNKPFTVWEAI